MSSILTNNGAMIALQTLKSINQGLAKTQSEISTGKSIATAKDNAAIWAISKTMESDVEGFKGISDALGLGQSTVAVARQAAETVTDLLKQMKGKIVAAQGENVDRAKLQTDITALRDQITSVVAAAQFNGLNMLSNQSKTAGSGTVNVLASLDRSSTGVAASSIKASKEDLGTGASSVTGTALTAAGIWSATASTNSNFTGTATAATVLTGAATAPTTSVTVAGVQVGFGYSIAITGSAGTLTSGTASANINTANDNTISYVARDGDTVEDVAKGLTEAYTRYVDNFRLNNTSLTSATTIAATVSGATITFTGANATGDNFSVQAKGFAATGNTIGGGLQVVANLSVSSTANAKGALRDIEGLITTSIDAAASFGSSAGRVDTQAKFVSGLMDALKSGIGTLVDADMEEASARLQALQVQQQLGVQSLSIANQAPQSILSLFR